MRGGVEAHGGRTGPLGRLIPGLACTRLTLVIHHRGVFLEPAVEPASATALVAEVRPLEGRALAEIPPTGFCQSVQKLCRGGVVAGVAEIAGGLTIIALGNNVGHCRPSRCLSAPARR